MSLQEPSESLIVCRLLDYIPLDKPIESLIKSIDVALVVVLEADALHLLNRLRAVY